MENAGGILVVDDELPLQLLLQDFVSSLGYEVRVASDGEQALQLLQCQSFHGVLADLKMPKLGGLELLRAIRALDPMLPVVIITGYPSVEVAVEVMKEGATDFLTKPVRLNHLEVVLHNLTQGQRPGPSSFSSTPVDLPLASDRGQWPDSTRRVLAESASPPDVSRVEFQVFSAHPEPEGAEACFLAGLVSLGAEKQGWAALTKGDEPEPFVLPAWDAPAPPPPEEPPSPQLREILQEQYEALLREQCAALLRQAEQDAQRLKEAGYAAGFAEGEQRGMAAAQQRVEEVLQSLGQALRDVGRLRAQILAQSEHQLVELILAIARKVLHHEGSINRDGILPLVQAGMKKLTQRQELCIKVHPVDMLFTASCKAQLLSFLDGIETIAFEEDATIPPGSCVIETPAEIVDLRWEEQLTEVAASLYRVMSDE